MKGILEELPRQHVEVRSQANNHDYRDDGVLEEYDERWIKIRKSSGETIYFPIANVRLLKPL